MNKNLFKLAVGLALLTSAATMHAQSVRLQASVPFSFTAGKTTLPAGVYIVESGGRGTEFLALRNIHSGHSAFVLSNACEKLHRSETSKLVFHRYGDQYFLSELWVSGRTIGNQISTSHRETEIAQDQTKNNILLTAELK